MNQLTPEILLVEDNPNDLELALHAFEKSGLSKKIHVARDGAEALDFIFCRGAYKDRSINQTLGVILLDLKLPKISGLEVLEQIKHHPQTKNIPVVVLSSSKEERDISHCYENGVNSYVVKSVDFEEFMKAIQHLETFWLQLNHQPYA